MCEFSGIFERISGSRIRGGNFLWHSGSDGFGVYGFGARLDQSTLSQGVLHTDGKFVRATMSVQISVRQVRLEDLKNDLKSRDFVTW